MVLNTFDEEALSVLQKVSARALVTNSFGIGRSEIANRAMRVTRLFSGKMVIHRFHVNGRMSEYSLFKSSADVRRSHYRIFEQKLRTVEENVWFIHFSMTANSLVARSL